MDQIGATVLAIKDDTIHLNLYINGDFYAFGEMDKSNLSEEDFADLQINSILEIDDNGVRLFREQWTQEELDEADKKAEEITRGIKWD